MAATAPADDVHRIISTAVDGGFYRAVNPDLAAAGVDPIRHYAEAGWREGRDPAPWFSTRAYLSAHPDVAQAGWNPLHHYLTVGRRQGREVAGSIHAGTYLLTQARRSADTGWTFEALLSSRHAVADAALAAQRARDLVATEFDPSYYAASNPDVAGFDPLDHFMSSGWREGRDPNLVFSVKDYLETYPDIAEAGINPFVHYLETGRTEGRIARSQLGFRYEIIRRLRPLEDRVAEAAAASRGVRPKGATALATGLAAARTGLADLHLTFSHDDYTANTGGVQLCLQREGARIAELGRDHLHLYPAKPWPVVRLADEAGPLGVILNGTNLGAFSAQTIARTLGKAASDVAPGARSFAVHSLLGHAVPEVVAILRAVGLRAGYFWLHDFASLCAGFHLLRNDVEDCAAPPPDSAACGVCVHGPWRGRHLAEHRRLFEALDLTVVSPSQPTLDLWRAGVTLPAADEVVAPHATLIPRGPAPRPPKDRPFRLAFAGMPVAHKGWEVFRDLVLRHEGDRRYEFLHLGGRTPGGLPLAFRQVVTTEDQPRAMQDALREADVDAVLIWPLCRETFSFTAYEAVAAGCAVITGPDSGNVAAFVAGTDHGIVLPDEDQLAAALASGSITGLSRAVREPRLYDLAFSGLTADLLPRTVR